MQSSKNCEKHENYRKHHDATWFSDNHKQTASLWFWAETRDNVQTIKDSTSVDKQQRRNTWRLDQVRAKRPRITKARRPNCGPARIFQLVWIAAYSRQAPSAEAVEPAGQGSDYSATRQSRKEKALIIGARCFRTIDPQGPDSRA